MPYYFFCSIIHGIPDHIKPHVVHMLTEHLSNELQIDANSEVRLLRSALFV